ncbi:MAG: winged helix-turn-helix transcriptional regulator [Filimonas sp.]|nr:winged helix-turn-helix transcriptional regulator [Filimonas sp.]
MKRDVFYAIADPTRRAILQLLAAQAMTPNAIATHFNTTRQAISKHIQVLAECGLLRQQQNGREIYYYINAEEMKELDNWLAQFRAVLNKRLNQLENLLKKLKHKNHD